MEIIGKIVRGLASIPLIGGALVFILGFLPLLAVIPLNLPNGLSLIIGGLLMAAWCYFLSAKKIINNLTPLLPLPLWIFGVIMALAGVFGIVTGTWDKPTTEPETVMQSESDSISSESAIDSVSEPVVEQVTKQDRSEMSHQMSKTEQDKALDETLQNMEKSLEDLKALEKTIGAEKIQKIYDAQDTENSLSFKEAMAEMQKKIDELKRQGAGNKDSD